MRESTERLLEDQRYQPVSHALEQPTQLQLDPQYAPPVPLDRPLVSSMGPPHAPPALLDPTPSTQRLFARSARLGSTVRLLERLQKQPVSRAQRESTVRILEDRWKHTVSIAIQDTSRQPLEPLYVPGVMPDPTGIETKGLPHASLATLDLFLGVD
jgi:hypothetical protein